MEVAIVAALRTPVGSFCKGLSQFESWELGKIVIKELINKTQIPKKDISEVIMGQVLTAGAGQNPARKAAINAGLSEKTIACTINQVCGSGLKSIMLAAQSIALEPDKIIIAGGQESMSMAPHVIHLRKTHKIGSTTLQDTMILDGLTDTFSHFHMGETVEQLAAQYNIGRIEQDTYAAHSHFKASRAQHALEFADEIIPISNSLKGALIDTDEYIRHDSSLEKLQKLKPAFQINGTVTAGNASGINDGAAACILMSLAEAKKRGLKPIAVIKSFGQNGVSPDLMSTGPIGAVKEALSKAGGWSVQDLDFIEANEAFAAQSIHINKEIGWDVSKVNLKGGAIALGHPIGASGARILVTLLHIMKHEKKAKGIATLCIGGGMGIAICVERI